LHELHDRSLFSNTNPKGAVPVNCNEVRALITAAVDGELDDATRQAFLNAIDACPDCRAEYEAELATKLLLRSRLKKVKAPQSLVDAIKRQTIGNTEKVSSSKFSATDIQENMQSFGQTTTALHLRRRLTEYLFINPNLNSRVNPIFAMTLATIVLAMLVFTGFMRSRHSSLIDGDAKVEFAEHSNLSDLTAQAFHVPTDGNDLRTKDATVAGNHAAHVLGFTPVIPKLAGFSITLARPAAMQTINAAEIRFTHTANPKVQAAVYVMKEEDIAKAQCLTPEAMTYISADGRNFYETVCPNGNQVVVWKWGETIYAATVSSPQIALAKSIANPHWETVTLN
jgi:anti-sigma factor (TIGR02949 family)